METYETLVTTIALTLGVSWASGINLYAALLMLGFAGHTGNLSLPPDLLVLQDPMVMVAAGLMYCVEFFADKTPGVDTGWDALHTFIRIPAGALLAAGAVGEVGAPMELAAAILGGGMAATTHATKASARMLINTSPEPASNWLASVSEDVVTIGGLWMAINNPILFLVLLIVFLCLVVWLLPKMWRLIGALFRKIRSWFGGRSNVAIQADGPAAAEEGKPVATGNDESDSGLSGGLAGTSDIVARLERLSALRAAGDLTEEEFEGAKRRLFAERSDAE